MAKVLVTGGTGLYGSAIREHIEGAGKNCLGGAQWVFLSSKDADLRDEQQTFAVFEREKPTHVIHLAAYVGGLFANMAQKVEFYRYNILINDNVMEACRTYSVKKCV
jgi:GDP-L-fucose synthase